MKTEAERGRLGFAKKKIPKGTDIQILVMKDGSLYSDHINFFESVTSKTLEELKNKKKKE
jgi:hypothetical protein